MSLPKYKPFFEWARFALTGDPLATAPADDVLYFVARSALAEFLSETPCASDWETFEADGDDEAAFREAVGAKIAERFLGTRAGVKFASETKQIKLGPVTKTVAGQSADDLKTVCRAAASAARARLSCVRAQAAAAPTISLFAFAGRNSSRCGYR